MAATGVNAMEKPSTPVGSLTLRCFACGTERQIDDDGRRVRMAKLHVAACTKGPGAGAESHLSLVSGDRLEVTLGNGTVWFQIARDGMAEVPTPQETVKHFYRDWYRAIIEGPEGFAAAFASDGVLMPPDAPAVVGREAIKKWRVSQANAPFRIVPESANQDEIRVEGYAAYVRTTLRGRRTPRDGGEAVPFEEKYLDLLRKTEDGGWEFVARMWNNNA
jgi:uncharacterized protein (TIGR02246 family)